LRGWLKFNYTLNSSRYREELILQHIQEERLYALLEHKLLIETVIRATAESTSKNFYKPIFDVHKALIELKLPTALPDDKMNKADNTKQVDDLSEWKEFLEKVNKK